MKKDKNETKVVESASIKTALEVLNEVFENNYSDKNALFRQALFTEKYINNITVLDAMEAYAFQFKNTDAVRVINDRIAELENLEKTCESEMELETLINRSNEANLILKLIQP